MKMGLLSYWYRFCYTLWSPFYDLLAWGFTGWRRRSIKLADLQPGVVGQRPSCGFRTEETASAEGLA